MESFGDEFSKCVKRIFENQQENFEQFKTMMFNLDQYLSRDPINCDCLLESLLENYLELLSSEIPQEEKPTFITHQINQLYQDLFLYFQTICNEYLVSYLHKVRGFDHHEHEFKEIPQDLVIEKPFTIIELCSNHLRENELVNQNLKEKFSQFKERKKNRSLEVSYKDLKSSFTRFGHEFSESFENLLTSFQMHEMVRNVKKELDHCKSMSQDSNMVSVFSKPPLSYVFCLDGNEQNVSKLCQLLSRNQPEIFELKELILNKFDNDGVCEIPIEYLRQVSFEEECKIFDSPIRNSNQEKKVNSPKTEKQRKTKHGETTPKRKLFAIKKDPSRELRELDLLEKEVEQLEEQAKEHQEIFERCQALKDGNTKHSIRKDIQLKMEEQTVKNRLETIITMGYSCLALCSIYKCESYRKKLSNKLEELSKSLISPIIEEFDNSQLIVDLENIIFEHSYYLGYQIPSLLTRLYSDLNCSKFKGYQRLYKHLEIIHSFPPNEIIDLSPLNVAEMLKLSTRKLQSDLEILTQVRHFKSISLYNSHETSCNIVNSITTLCKLSKYQSLIILILTEFNTIQVMTELLRLTLKHFDSFKDYIQCLLEFFMEMAGRMFNPEVYKVSNKKVELTMEKESEILKNCLGSTSFAFSLILCLSESVEKLNWNQSTVYDLNCFLSDSLKSLSNNDEETMCIQIAKDSSFLLTFLLENDCLTSCLNNCNRLERLLPMTIVKSSRFYRNLELGRQILKLMNVSSRKIHYSSNDGQLMEESNSDDQVSSKNDKKPFDVSFKSNEFLDNIQIDRWKFSYREIFMENDAPPILLMILHKFILNYLDDNTGIMQDEKLELDNLKNEACRILPVISQSLLSLLETELSTVESNEECNSPRSVDSSDFLPPEDETNVHETEDQQIRREIYTCLIYILLQCLFLERSEQNLNQDSPEFDLFSIGWFELVRLMKQSPEFKLCVNRQFTQNIYMKELNFLHLMLMASGDKFILLRDDYSVQSIQENESNEKRRLDKELMRYDSNCLKNLQAFLKEYRQDYPLIEIEEAYEQDQLVVSPYELALFSLKKQRFHTKTLESDKANHVSRNSSVLSLVETSCLKYTNEFFKHYDSLGVFDDNQIEEHVQIEKHA
ncbi:predicted protein [Naegleria gruberi]|uniref:Predicted protein n=1 Tax=Naegleria gruberi TaxID=5762 RepID=D2VDG2_NAEGR|nr:uncharacterized protein NAEGRDRAFT_66831 [Naegleria gruberi]EFC45228.1 predicted protein [Naegleria gruberi]|eukprot:XP_002677972.1 predicted protein [Naegleria gruberi strain NEG-M]